MSIFNSKSNFIVKKELSSRVLDIILSSSLSYIKAEFLKNDNLKITIYSHQIVEYKKAFDDVNIELFFNQEKGFITAFQSNKYRVGIFIGLLLLLISSFVSTMFVWKINITGNTSLTKSEVVAELDKADFHIGSFIPKINYKKLHNKVLISSDKISWISVNIVGNVANVVIKEKLDENENKAFKDKYTNIISKFDGQISFISVEEGRKQVSIGDVVKKGDLLISGVLDSQSQGVRYVDAKGTIKAYVNKKIEIKVPYDDTKKVYTGKTYTRKEYKIFEYIIKNLNKYRNCEMVCDIIEKNEQIYLFNLIELPIYCITEKHLEYEIQNVKYTNEQIIDIAFQKLRVEMDKSLLNAELISKKVSTSYDSKYFYVFCELYCLEDIGSEVEFKVENNGG